jgi:uncharacterized membrane protein YqaE (UPF0057 family)
MPNSDGYDDLEHRILAGKYGMADKALYGGLMFGAFVIPINFFKVVFTTIFPPLGELINIISDFIMDDFPYITWDGFIALIHNLQRIVYSFILTSMFYIPGLLYTLSNISTKHPTDQAESVIRIKKY